MKTGTKVFPQLEHGPLWKTNSGYVQIWHIGKRLIELYERAVPAIGTIQEFWTSQ
jgi:hypothetical protein